VQLGNILDDVINNLRTNRINIRLTPDGPNVPPEEGPPVIVWAAISDNIYDEANGLYLVGDVIHIQYSQIMSPSADRSEYYSLDGIRLQEGLSVELETVIYAYGSDGMPIRGTLASIHLPFNTLGEGAQQDFITKLLGNPYAAPQYDPYDPDKPWRGGTPLTAWLTVDADHVTSLKNEKLVLPVDNDGSIQLTYRRTANTVIQPHIHAYVNSLTFDPNRLDLAALITALESPFVRHITPALPFYVETGFNTGVWVPTNDLSAIPFNMTYLFGYDFAFSAPVGPDQQMKTVGPVTIIANEAETITVKAPINGDLDITSVSATELTIEGDISGDIILDTPNLKSINLKNGVTAATLTVANLAASAVLAISEDSDIGILNMQSGGTIENGGSINTLNIATNQTVVLEGTYRQNDGVTPTTINYDQIAYVVNRTGRALTMQNKTSLAGTLGEDTPILEDGTYPASPASPATNIPAINAAVLSAIDGLKTSSATMTSLPSVVWSADLYKLAGYNMDAVNARGGQNGMAVTNALLAYAYATSTSLDPNATTEEIQGVINGVVTAFNSIVTKAGTGTTGALTDADMALFAQAGIKMNTRATRMNINANIKYWLTPRTFEGLQSFIENLQQ
jgi:hypothetical protein